MALDRMRTSYYGPHAFDTMNESSLYKPGELGNVCLDVSGNRRGQLIQVDSGCTSGSVTGVVAAHELAFWKDKNTFLVTNDPAQANAINAPAGGWGNAGNPTLDARNFVAGIFQNAITAAYYGIILQRTDQAAGYAVKSAVGGTYNAGVMLVANTGTAADATSVAAGTAPTSRTIGVVLGARNGSGNVPCWVQLSEED